MTGSIEGGRDFSLSFNAPAQAKAPNGDNASADAMQRQIGIRMEMQKHPVEVLVIDKLQRNPSEN
ncbi:MAG TPA: TIGR03435 family protein [Bryobacteraceae bacterium]|nr:TIGR03435 family protein [Bryobacteraceae bacterium]